MARKLIKEFTPGRGYTKQDWDEVSDTHEADARWEDAKPFAEVFPEIAAQIDAQLAREAQDASTKATISLRLDQDVLDAFRATGPGWQARMNAALRAAMPKPAPG